MPKKEIKTITNLDEIDEDAIAEGFIHPVQRTKPAEPPKQEKKAGKKKAKKES
jgi:hypothetical protein